MNTIASQITSQTIVYSTVYSNQRKTSKLRVTGLCEGNSPLTGEFPPQKASNAKNVSIWWRHYGLAGMPQRKAMSGLQWPKILYTLMDDNTVKMTPWLIQHKQQFRNEVSILAFVQFDVF